MKKLLTILILCLFLSGCTIVASPEWKSAIHQHATITKILADRAEEGKLSKEQMVDALKSNAKFLKALDDAVHGRKPNGS